jgi:hypothetical protein
MLDKAQHLQGAREIRLMLEQQRHIHMFPHLFKIGGFSRRPKVYKKQSGILMVPPMAVGELVAYAKAIKDARKSVGVFGLQSQLAAHWSNQRIGRLESASGCADAVERREYPIAKAGSDPGNRAGHNLQFTERGKQPTNDIAFDRKGIKRRIDAIGAGGVPWPGCISHGYT